uniref:cysteine dioxygenase n=1 Tax=Biomphalaria glabrata TaxID=6526 RepID=A0A2C9LAW3_BIOGL
MPMTEGKMSLEKLLTNIEAQFQGDTCNVGAVGELIHNYKSNKVDWEKYAFSNPAEGYSRNLVVEKSGKFNALILCWQPGKGSKIHAHEGSNCFLKVLQGELREEMFDWPTKVCQMIPREEKIYTDGDLNLMTDDKGLHRVTNNNKSEMTISLHIYLPPFRHCSWFEEETGKEVRAEMTFTSIEGKRTEVKGSYNPLAGTSTEQQLSTMFTDVSKCCPEKCGNPKCAKQCENTCCPEKCDGPQCAKHCEDSCCPEKCDGPKCAKQCEDSCCPEKCGDGPKCAKHCEDSCCPEKCGDGPKCAKQCEDSCCPEKCGDGTKCAKQCEDSCCPEKCDGPKCAKQCEDSCCPEKCDGPKCAKQCEDSCCPENCDGPKCAKQCEDTCCPEKHCG